MVQNCGQIIGDSSNSLVYLLFSTMLFLQPDVTGLISIDVE